MALNLYRRHRRDCKAGHPEDSKSSDLDERRKGWKRCECPIFVTGSLQGKFRRQSTGKWEWSDAKAVAESLETAGTFSGATVSTPPPPQPVERIRITIADATAAFLSYRQNRGVAPATLKKYRTFTRQLLAYAEGRGYVCLDQLDVSDMDRFSASWKDGDRAKAKKLERLKGFIRFCIKRKFIAEDITSDLEAPEGASVPLPKSPFSDEELESIYKACDMFGPAKPGPGHRNWTGEDVKDFVYLSVYTGLRISDIATFDITKRLDGNDVFLRMHKTKKELYTWIPDWLVNRLRDREKKHGALIFRCGVTMNMRQLTEIWRGKRLDRVFAVAGPFEEKPTPHRFRHTFVRILLEKGVPIADVAELIGDTEQTVRKSYSKWVKGRQRRLTEILKEAFDDKPKPKLVVIR
jgi:integrase/recombinase XerD